MTNSINAATSTAIAEPTASPFAIPRLLATALLSAALLCPAQSALAQFTYSQFADRLVGTGAIGAAQQGWSVAVSGDGTTIIVGGRHDNSELGAAWVYRRGFDRFLEDGFTQEAELVGGNNIGSAREGTSVGVSADGNTAIVGGPKDNNFAGAAWVFTRRSGAWSQQAKLVGTSAVGAAEQGQAVALSGDGNTAIVGGFDDNSGAGAAWVFARSGATWTQQAKLVGTTTGGPASQGVSVALSGDGNTAIVGGSSDSNGAGAAWVFTRSAGVWTQQGGKLTGNQAIGAASQGSSVALSTDGNTAIIGGPLDNTDIGAAWVFTRSAGVWSQQIKLVDSPLHAHPNQGQSVALSADGNKAMVSGYDGGVNLKGQVFVYIRSGGTWTEVTEIADFNQGDGRGESVALSGDGNIVVLGAPLESGAGAAYLYSRDGAVLNPAATHKFNGTENHLWRSSIAWRQSGGLAVAWAMINSMVTQSFNFGTVPTNWQLVGQRDFNNDGFCDLLWRDSVSGTAAIWLLNAGAVQQSGTIGAVPLNWSVVGTSDFNYDGKGDILWRDSSTGTVAIWLMNRLSVQQTGSLGAVPLNWTVAATDGKGNIFWRDTNTGTVAIWEVYGLQVLQTGSLGAVPLNWTIAGVGDFDGNGSTDILWRDGNTGTVAIWLMDGLSIKQTGSLGVVPSNWIIAETGDFSGDYNSDILWRDTTTGTVAIWFMDGLRLGVSLNVATVGLDWTIQGMNAE